MTKIELAVLALLLVPTAWAGHGLMNSFGGIAWLPETGPFPGSAAFLAEDTTERLQLRMAAKEDSRFALAVAQSRRKLATAEAALRAGKPAVAREALAAWLARLDVAEATLPVEGDGTAARRFANELLEQQYIIATDYLDLPSGTRQLLQQVFVELAPRYQRVRQRLAPATQEALFFREEEIRWARQQTQAADEQGL